MSYKNCQDPPQEGNFLTRSSEGYKILARVASFFLNQGAQLIKMFIIKLSLETSLALIFFQLIRKKTVNSNIITVQVSEKCFVKTKNYSNRSQLPIWEQEFSLLI